MNSLFWVLVVCGIKKLDIILFLKVFFIIVVLVKDNRFFLKYRKFLEKSDELLWL